MILCLVALILAQSVDVVVAKAIAARGGVKRIKSIKSQRLTGRISLISGESGPLIVEMKRPGMVRETVTLADKSMVRISDGIAGWAFGTLRTPSAPQPVSPEELRNLAASADIEGPLVDYQAKGHRIELAGKERIGKREAYKLVIYLKTGENRIDFIDCKSHLEVKWQGLVNGNMFESYFRDYREVKGLQYAFEIDSGNQKIVLDKVEVNPKLDAARFSKP
jgi:hypothetical protein